MVKYEFCVQVKIALTKKRIYTISSLLPCVSLCLFLDQFLNCILVYRLYILTSDLVGAQTLSLNISICVWRKDISRQVSLPTSITPDHALGLDLGKGLRVLCCSLLLPDHVPPSFLAPPTLNLIYQNILPHPPTLLTISYQTLY